MCHAVWENSGIEADFFKGEDFRVRAGNHPGKHGRIRRSRRNEVSKIGELAAMVVVAEMQAGHCRRSTEGSRTTLMQKRTVVTVRANLGELAGNIAAGMCGEGSALRMLALPRDSRWFKRAASRVTRTSFGGDGRDIGRVGKPQYIRADVVAVERNRCHLGLRSRRSGSDR